MGTLALIAVTASVVHFGCSESDGSDHIVRPPVEHAEPPAAGAAHPGNGAGAVFAVDQLFYGNSNRFKRAAFEAWKQFGFDIDHQISDCTGKSCEATSFPHCRPRDGGNAAFVFPDGEGGIDNSFGANIVPILFGADARSTSAGNKVIAAGQTTLLFQIDKLGSDSAYNPLWARFFQGAPLGHDARFDGSDVWPVSNASLGKPGDLSSALNSFPNSWVVDDTWVSGSGDLAIEIPIFGSLLVLPLHHAIVAMDLAADRRTATNGTISGVVEAAFLAAQTKRLGANVDISLCDADQHATIDSVKSQILQAADIMLDGSHGTDADICDGISVGLGFNATRVELGAAVDVPALEDPCAK